jgi:hypothetical protein
MAITMQGAWTVKVKSKSAAFSQRFVIQGSDNADGTYEGIVGAQPQPINVAGAQWSISVMHQPGRGAEWTSSAERLTTPTRSQGQIVFDILSNDSGDDEDYNDLILTCSMAESPSDYVIYGRVRTYKNCGPFNPCFFFDFVVDTYAQLKDLLRFKNVRPVLDEFYPERMRKYDKRRPIVEEPFPPDPIPFRPMMFPMRVLPSDTAEKVAQVKSISTRASQRQLGSSVVTKFPAYARDFAKIKEKYRTSCVVKGQPGLLLRFLEYDRTADELAGGPYSGEGHRQILGLTVTDEQGNYIFRFTRSLEEVAEEFADVLEGGPELVEQLRPDIIVQIVTAMIEESDVLFETALFPNIPNLKRINICIPESSINPGPSVCQGGRAIQSIGNIWTLPGVGNTLDADGRITATNPTELTITRGAWVGRLHMFACFTDANQPKVKYYTIRYRRPSAGTWSFVQEEYRHIFVAKIGNPSAPEHKVGPFPTGLKVDGQMQTVPAYKNIEEDDAWIKTHRLRKIKLTSSLYEASLYQPEDSPRTAEFKIEGYDIDGNKVPGAEDSINLYLDNRAIFGDIASISMGQVTPGECAFFELPTPNEPLTVRFKVHHPGGFLQNYGLTVIRGSNTGVPVSDTTLPQQPLSLTYDQATYGSFFFGTLNAVGPDSEGYVSAELQPTGGAWLPPGKDFCAFAFEIHARPRVTDGYGLAGSRRLDVELVGISYTPPAPPPID